jgi:signal-transduction protein with cAMP-binding, CBS, and nucleotidyltransferase domain
MLTGKDPNAVFQQMMSTNPKFAQFVQENKGKSAEQIAQEHGIDLPTVIKLLKG